jgi:beta-phosphoglucomutase
MVQQVDAIFFDFDGVLADTEPLHWAAWNEALARVGVHIPWEVFQAEAIGVSDRSFLARLAARQTPPRQPDELWALYPTKRNMFQELTGRTTLIQEATRRLLQGLSQYRLAVVTSSARFEIESILKREKVLSYFDAGVYGDEVTNLKPNPEPYMTAIQRTGAAHALVIEDSASGAASAREAGCEVIVVASPEEVPAKVAARLGVSL